MLLLVLLLACTSERTEGCDAGYADGLSQGRADGEDCLPYDNPGQVPSQAEEPNSCTWCKAVTDTATQDPTAGQSPAWANGYQECIGNGYDDGYRQAAQAAGCLVEDTAR
jgi:flagellar biosynthesis/type III secretory pathway protein FliH